MSQFSDSFTIGGFPFQSGYKVHYHEYSNPKITELINKYNIKSLKDFTTETNREVLAKEIIEELFVKCFLSRSIRKYSKILTPAKGEPDFRIKENKKITLTAEVYAPSLTKRVLDKSGKSKDGIITYSSIMHPLHSDMITKKINKYFDKYPDSKQCLFLFFIDYLNEKCVMRTFRNFYGDTIHSNGALAHIHAGCYCEENKMSKVAGLFLTEGHIDIKNKTLNYRDVVFVHNPFCDDGYKLPFTFFNSKLVFQSYIHFLDRKPLRGKWWGNFLIRFYQNKYPNYLFLKDDIDYCKQAYPEIVQ